jgi:hypothetical protein
MIAASMRRRANGAVHSGVRPRFGWDDAWRAGWIGPSAPMGLGIADWGVASGWDENAPLALDKVKVT